MFARLGAGALIVGLLLATAGAAWAALGQPTPWQLGLQDAATPVMADIIWFHNYLLWIIAAITAFVLVLLGIIVLRFNARANPTPTRTTHNTLLEVLWTIVPVVILLFIAVPSFRLLFVQLDVPKPDLTVKATGKQWYWSYNYPDNGQIEFDSLMRPGTASILMPNDGTANEWITSEPVVITRTVLFTGTTISLSTASSRGWPSLRSPSLSINESNSNWPLSG